MVNLAVGEVEGHEEWHLPTFDPHNQNKYHYKLHSLDIYFWTQADALSFVNGVRRVLPPNQVDIQDEPGPPARHEQQHSVDVNPLVQKLEDAAIFADPKIPPPPPPPQTNGRDTNSNSISSNVPSFAPPPLSAVASDGDDREATSTTSPASFAPMAYNPAAPAAPEQIRHREKTPPPEDGEVNPLHARLAQDAGTPFSPGLVSGMPSHMSPLSPGIPPPQFSAVPGAPSFPGPPVQSPGMPPQGFGTQGAGGHGHPGLVRAATMPVHGMPSPALQSPYGAQQFPGSPGFAPQQQQQQQQHPQPPPLQHHQSTPGAIAGQHQPQPHGTPTPPSVTSPGLPLPPPPPGGFSNYTYATQQGIGHGPNDYSIHQMAYRPTEGEAAVRYKPKKEPRGRLEENAGRLERGVTGMFKKFEKKFG
jgi:hypothetical protein